MAHQATETIRSAGSTSSLTVTTAGLNAPQLLERISCLLQRKDLSSLDLQIYLAVLKLFENALVALPPRKLPICSPILPAAQPPLLLHRRSSETILPTLPPMPPPPPDIQDDARSSTTYRTQRVRTPGYDLSSLSPASSPSSPANSNPGVYNSPPRFQPTFSSPLRGTPISDEDDCPVLPTTNALAKNDPNTMMPEGLSGAMDFVSRVTNDSYASPTANRPFARDSLDPPRYQPPTPIGARSRPSTPSGVSSTGGSPPLSHYSPATSYSSFSPNRRDPGPGPSPTFAYPVPVPRPTVADDAANLEIRRLKNVVSDCEADKKSLKLSLREARRDRDILGELADTIFCGIVTDGLIPKRRNKSCGYPILDTYGTLYGCTGHFPSPSDSRMSDGLCTNPKIIPRYLPGVGLKLEVQESQEFYLANWTRGGDEYLDAIKERILKATMQLSGPYSRSWETGSEWDDRVLPTFSEATEAHLSE